MLRPGTDSTNESRAQHESPGNPNRETAVESHSSKNEAGTRKLGLAGRTVGRVGHRGIPAAKYRKTPIDIIAADDVKKSYNPEMLPPRRNHAR